jgi:hypothetical protein
LIVTGVNTPKICNMSWVTATDLESHMDELREDLGIDVQWEPSVDRSPHDILFNNLESDIDEQAFLFSVLIRDKIVAPSEDADSFFSDTESRTDGTCPVLMVYASRDETLVGRCVTVQRVGLCIAVTIVHSDINIHDVSLSAYVEGMYHFHDLADHLSSLDEQGPRHIMEDSLKDCGMLVAFKTLRLVTRHMSEIDPIQEEGDTYGAAPDLVALFAHARGPVQQVEAVPHGVRCAATLMGGAVAVMYTGEGDDDVTRNAFIKSLGVRVAFIASHHDTRELELSSANMSTKRCDKHKVVHIHTRGVSMMHLAHVIGPACDLANEEYRRIYYRNQVMVRLLEDGCNWRVQKVVNAHQQELLDAKAVFARTINRNLERIKTHLWRPTGRLVSTMIDDWSEGV